jgi:hypothetical protein
MFEEMALLANFEIFLGLQWHQLSAFNYSFAQFAMFHSNKPNILNPSALEDRRIVDPNGVFLIFVSSDGLYKYIMPNVIAVK